MSSSIISFANESPHIIKGSQAFIQKLKTVPDPIVQVASLHPDPNAQIAWVILGCVLNQYLGLLELKKLLFALNHEFPGDRLWYTPVPKSIEIRTTITKAIGAAWPNLDYAPGIFWSVGDFVRKNFPLTEWILKPQNELIHSLIQIYYMGKKAPHPKVLACFQRFQAKAPLGLGVHRVFLSKKDDLALPMGARRFMGFMGPTSTIPFSKWSTEKKIKETNALFRYLSPDCPEMSAHALSFFLEKGHKKFFCQELQGSCKACPLYRDCPYAEV
ncbi:MAG: hypothetical protein GX116_02565 [Fibrobacter sp.]|jgi:hypothetical protein|nr:hypothetical protein [Fibrobacter sp.]